jgi:GT2 family glycosyltransferase
MIPATSQIGISITTKDRWDDLEITLDHLRMEGLDSLETIVIDDGSDAPLPSHFAGRFSWVKFMRFDSSQGYIPRRNRIAQLLTTPLILGLDDDSFPIAGDLQAAASWLMEHPKVCALAFRVSFIGDPPPSPFATKPPFPVKSFIGCANLLKRELFLSLGGYEERLGYSAEEGEFCIKALQKGYETYAFPSVVVEHRVATTARNWGPRTRQIIRNNMLLGLWYYPFPISYLRAIRFGPVQIMKDAQRRKYWKDVLIGCVQGLLCYFSWPHEKKRLSWRQFQKLEKLRHPSK